jgi:chromosome segregation ATPase
MRRGVGMQAWEEETEALLRVGNRALEVTIRDLEKERGLLMEECQRLKDQVHELEFNLVQFESVVSEQLEREREWKRERGGMAEVISGLQAELVGIRNAVVEEIERGKEEREEVESVREALRAECEKEKKRAESEAWARGEAARLEQELAR